MALEPDILDWNFNRWTFRKRLLYNPYKDKKTIIYVYTQYLTVLLQPVFLFLSIDNFNQFQNNVKLD